MTSNITETKTMKVAPNLNPLKYTTQWMLDNRTAITTATSTDQDVLSSFLKEQDQLDSINPCLKTYLYHPHSSSTFSKNKNEEYHFEKPPECPIFRPNDEEFKNPLAYISKIRPIAEKYGIAKILPPKTWNPPFTVDVDKLKFTPRVQRLNELEAKTRIKLNFLDQIAKFWELQGSSLKIPMVERKALDLYSLHRIVQEEGGLEQTTKERKWSKVAHRMQYPAGKSIGAIIKGHYERILHPFDIYTSGKVIDIKLEPESDYKDYKPHRIVSRQQITPPNETTARRSKRFANMSASQESACGLGSYSASIKTDFKEIGNKHTVKMFVNRHNRARFIRPGTPVPVATGDPLAKYICHICNRGDVEEAMLLCDGCDDSYHTFCLLPPLHDIPKGDWRCPRCVVEEVNKPTEAFGFEQAQREYTLQQFGEMADQFKADYFRRPVHLVPTDLVEREFWRIVSSIDEDVTVEYGADLHTMHHGSGFPTKSSLYLLAGDQEYAESSWNLNNLPLLEESILGHINADISGMKIPWMYVGMCFATFCWHNEDHWSYSINYLHWGEPKTWYGVPGCEADIFEKTMKSAAPELFASQPDLLHQLVTILNPNILMQNDVSVYRTDQHAGEFVITFPRAYHAGFNQGYNFAEAVNFAPADWLKMGRDCINHYSILRRFCVFSHDELVCKMALEPEKLNFSIASACYIDMVKMLDSEKKLRKGLLEWGVAKAEREAFELVPDDARQCKVCKTTCFLSAVSCQCTKQIVCLRHYTELCECKPEYHCLQYRYTLDEMPLMLKKLQNKAQSFEVWLTKCRDIIDPQNSEDKITLEELQDLVQEAVLKKYPSSVLVDRLNSAVVEAKKCVTVIQQLDINKVRTRTRHSNDLTKYQLTMNELELFVEEIDNLCCIIKEGQSVRELLMLGKQFVTSAKHLLSKKINKINEKVLEKLIEEGFSLCIELHDLKDLRVRYEQVSWYNRSRRLRNSTTKLQINDLNRLINEASNLVPDPFIEKEISLLQNLVISGEIWEKAIKGCLQANSQSDPPGIETLLEAADRIQVEVPSKQILKDAFKKAKEWLHIVENLQKSEHYPYYHTLESVINRGLNIPLKLGELDRIKKHLDSAREWKDKAAKVFLRKQLKFELLDVLSPRVSALMIGTANPKRIPLMEQFTENLSPAQMVEVFKKAEEREIRDMRELRRINMSRNPLDDRFCFCNSKFSNNMYLCQLCLDWYHRECVPPVTAKESLVMSQNTSFVKYLCPSCMRSRRPRLEAILSLLVSLQRLPIRLPEGEALQCLTERAMNWQDRARQAFATEDVASALAALSVLSQKKCSSSDMKKVEEKLTIQISNEETDEEITETEVVNFDSGGEDYVLTAHRSICNDALQEPEHFEEDPGLGCVSQLNRQDPMNKSDLQNPQSNIQNTKEIEHAYSVPSAGVTSVKCPNSETSHTLTKKPSVSIELKRSTREVLENLMMEGDILEVSLEETTHLWKILNTSKPLNSELTPIQQMCKTFSIVHESKELQQVESPVHPLKKRQMNDFSTGFPSKRSWKGSDGSRRSSTKREKKNKDEIAVDYARFDDDDASATKSPPSGSSTNVRKRKRAMKLLSKNDLLTLSDDDEECRAENCQKPSGREVDWVQCDGDCNEWFHMFCVGLERKQIKPDDDYICNKCLKKNMENVSKEEQARVTHVDIKTPITAESNDTNNCSSTIPNTSTKFNKSL